MDTPALSTEQLETVMSSLFDFVTRVSSDTSNKKPEEVLILPAMTTLLLQVFGN